MYDNSGVKWSEIIRQVRYQTDGSSGSRFVGQLGWLILLNCWTSEILNKWDVGQVTGLLSSDYFENLLPFFLFPLMLQIGRKQSGSWLVDRIMA